jgi:hypothetical protein
VIKPKRVWVVVDPRHTPRTLSKHRTWELAVSAAIARARRVNRHYRVIKRGPTLPTFKVAA